MNGDVCRPSVQRKETLSSSAVAVKQTATNDDVWPAALTQTTNEASSRCPIIESPPGKIFLSSADNLPAKIRPARRRPGKLSAGGRFFRGGGNPETGRLFYETDDGRGYKPGSDSDLWTADTSTNDLAYRLCTRPAGTGSPSTTTTSTIRFEGEWMIRRSDTWVSIHLDVRSVH